MLLTGGQISAGISSFIVCLFTSILFISGYVLQQRTVNQLHGILHPPTLPDPVELSDDDARLMGPGSQRVLTHAAGTSINWKKVAYAQHVHGHEDVCEAVMIFAELARAKSPAQRVLLYPRSWEGAQGTSRLVTSMRLLKRAAQRYKASLVPVDAAAEDPGREESLYPQLNFLTLTMFNRILHLRPNGLILNSEWLDALFLLPMNASMVSLMGDESGVSHAMLMKPSMATFQKATRSDTTKGPLHAITADLSLGIDYPLLMSQTSSLRLVSSISDGHRNFTNFHDSAAYIRFSDPEIYGPQYDIPHAVHELAEPRRREERNLWNSVYDRFRVERMSVCGLDVKPLPDHLWHNE